MESELHTTDQSHLAACVAPEDLRCGDFVGVLSELSEYPSFLWDCSMAAATGELVRLWHLTDDGGTPLKIKAICLPFVFVKRPCGRHEAKDVRQVQLVRLKPRYAKTAWEALRAQAKKPAWNKR